MTAPQNFYEGLGASVCGAILGQDSDKENHNALCC